MMLVISDTNILSSFAAAQAFPLLQLLFAKSVIYIPPAVRQELQVGLNYGQAHLKIILEAITTNQLQILDLSASEKHLAGSLPRKLNAGESEAIALSQIRGATLLSNDKRAIRYCDRQGIEALDLIDLLRLLWKRNILSQAEVKNLISEMERVENLRLTPSQRREIFARRRKF